MAIFSAISGERGKAPGRNQAAPGRSSGGGESVPVPGRAEFISDPHVLLEGLEAGGVGVWRWLLEADELQWTRNLETIHDLPPGSFDGTLATFQRDIHPDDAARVWARISRCLETGEPYRVVYRTAPKENGDCVWVEASGALIEGRDGQRYMTGICTDVSARVRGETELQRRLRQQQAIEQFGSYAFGEAELQNILDRAVTYATDLLQAPLAYVLKAEPGADSLAMHAGAGWSRGLVGHATVGGGLSSQAGYTLMEDRPIAVFDLQEETRFASSPLLSYHGVRGGLTVVIPGTDSRPFGVLGVHTRTPREFGAADIDFLVSLANIVANSARHAAAEEHRRLLAREIAHRAGNLLQLVSTIANQTFSPDTDPQEARAAFSERLSSLSRANSLVARGGWNSARFAELAQEVLKPFIDRIDMEGIDVELPSDLCFDMGLVLHELVTNGVKYGSLGEPDGSATLKCEVWRDDKGNKQFGICWFDAVTRGSGQGRGGFGSRLIASLVERKWNGSMAVSLDDGYRFACSIPLAGGEPHSGAAEAAPA